MHVLLIVYGKHALLNWRNDKSSTGEASEKFFFFFFTGKLEGREVC